MTPSSEKNIQRDARQIRPRAVQCNNNNVKNSKCCCGSRVGSGRAAHSCVWFCLLRKQSQCCVDRCAVSKNSQAFVLSVGQSLTRISIPALGSTRRSVGIWRDLVENLQDDEGVRTIDLHGKVKKMKGRWQFLFRCLSHQHSGSL